MGLWNFVKSAGRSVGIGRAEAAEAPEAPPSADDLRREVEDLGVNLDGLGIEVEGDTVRLSGKTGNQEQKEKAILALGNVAGIAQVEEDVETEDGGKEMHFHTVEEGDTLSALAEEYLDAAARYQEIFDANKPLLTDPNKIYPGQVLRIPPK
jgi:nucleoid-associated protein YgaU